jgi:hypothetical protein
LFVSKKLSSGISLIKNSRAWKWEKNSSGASLFEVEAISLGRYFVSASVMIKAYRTKLLVMGVYGPADHTFSTAFLDEVSSKVSRKYPSSWRVILI